jgi:hypothetical protein
MVKLTDVKIEKDKVLAIIKAFLYDENAVESSLNTLEDFLTKYKQELTIVEENADD